MKLKDKCVIVTGGAMGIGLATVRRLLREGCIVTVWDINNDALESAKKEFQNDPVRIFLHKCDITNKNEVNELIKISKNEMGKIDILINNAGYVQGL